MANILATGREWLQRKRERHASVLVSYWRGTVGQQLWAFTAKTEYEKLDDLGLICRDEYRDYVIEAAKLVLPGIGVTLPQMGDKIKEVRGDTTYVYEVTPIEKSNHFDYTDPHHVTLRIHTKQVATE
jgi:hypothetical protein